ncbi:hypothetical protein ACP4OV_014761 [Aristida adscensionis]
MGKEIKTWHDSYRKKAAGEVEVETYSRGACGVGNES